ncbi:uncharacterized protein FPRO_15390 [Fusarium proliferatum ET1]|uniref:Related to maltase n=1 Tax=Fusarium proliferatum (strain ET1) TaxID=1227346 RepID=A0A1L7VYC6_FUSPR|nr:uncharacterized protein FPRO_15390 [Fusarium proliferatum ET1]CZR45435.1 related to maltase [Fusarium proliferatum ET1]
MGSLSDKKERTWWKEATIFQIWPASFKDSNSDGIGDLGGVIQSLDYIRSLGVDAVWVSPFYESPQVDFGYDISNYEAIHKAYGTMADAEALIDACHQRNMRILFDLVINHTSDQHPWFLESRQSRKNPKRDWYIWKPPKYDENGNRKPPNNWRSNFGGSCWAWDEDTQEYYLHLFADAQPDLNWENRAMREAVYDSAIRFWLRKGVDGFRVDTMTIYSKNPDYPDAPVADPASLYQTGRKFYAHQPEVFNILGEINQVLTEFGDDKMTVGEFGVLADTKMALDYVSASKRRVSMGFQFETACIGYSLNHWNLKGFSLVEFKASFEKWQRFIEGNDGWTCIFLENHDIARSVSRFANDDPMYRAAAAKALATLLGTSTGTLFLYQGQEIGITNAPQEWDIREYKDISASNYWKQVHDSTNGDEAALAQAMRNIRSVARDHARTPVQWNDEEHAGFTDAPTGPWMGINDNYREVNVQQQVSDPDSVFAFWQNLLKLRKKHVELFVYGSWETIDAADKYVMTYMKKSEGSNALVMINFTTKDQSCRDRAPPMFHNMEPVLTNMVNWRVDRLWPFEARVYIMEGDGPVAK